MIVDVTQVQSPPDRIKQLFGHALNARTGDEYRWPSLRVAFAAFADAAYATPILGSKIFEAFGYKYHEAEDVEARLAKRLTTKASDEYADLEAEWVFYAAAKRGLERCGLYNSASLSAADLVAFDRWDHVVDTILTELTILARRTEYSYTASVYLNGPLIDGSDEIILINLGENNGLRLRHEVILRVATDQDLALTHDARTPFRLPHGVENANTMLQFKLYISTDAPMEEYRRLYPFSVDVAVRVLDAIRLVADGDLGISYIHLLAATEFTPIAPTNYAWEYQPDNAVYIPRRTAFHVPPRTPLNEDDVVQICQLVEYRLSETDLKGLPVAIRRFRDSYERYEPDDPERLLDLAIALEALFLNDEDTKEQLRFRLSLRIARFLDSDVEARMQVFRSIRDLYDLRSRIAHGATVDTLKASDQKKLMKLQTEAPRIARRAIAKMMTGDGPIGLKKDGLRDWWMRIELS